jgi:hypothetical protein
MDKLHLKKSGKVGIEFNCGRKGGVGGDKRRHFIEVRRIRLLPTSYEPLDGLFNASRRSAAVRFR